MKIIKNADDAVCQDCKSVGQIIHYNGDVSCRNCGSPSILTRNGRLFVPQYKPDPEKMFQSSTYTPLMPDRRKDNRAYPKIKERRKNRVQTP